MTEDRAISLNAILAELDRWIGYLDEDMISRIQIGIKRLPSVTPCEDAISRDAVIKLAYDMSEIDGEHFGEPCIVVDVEDIHKLPSVNPQKWIPVSERLPEENKTVIASTKYGVFPETKYTKEYGWEWAYEAGADYWRELEDVKAWMPLPEPYEPQERSE